MLRWLILLYGIYSFRQLFGDLLPKARKTTVDAQTVNHVKNVFDYTFGLNAFVSNPDSAAAVPTGERQAQNTKYIKFACPRRCDFPEIAYVPADTNIIHLCPKFFAANLKVIPRTEAEARHLCSAESGVGLGSGTLFSSGGTTIFTFFITLTWTDLLVVHSCNYVARASAFPVHGTAPAGLTLLY